MKLLPSTSLSKLRALRGREQLYRLIWGKTLWLAAIFTLLTVCVLIDWAVDRASATPKYLRMLMTLLQIGVIGVGAYFWVIRPWQRGPSLIALATRAEEEIDEFDHRLVTAIQLNRAGADTSGMSEELIGIVSEEAERISGRHDLKRLADTRRLKWSLALFAVPCAAVAFLLLFFKPELLGILLKRQALIDAEIPRTIKTVRSIGARLWAQGDVPSIRYEVESREYLRDDTRAVLRVMIDGEADQTYDMAMITRLDDRRAIFGVEVTRTLSNFRHSAQVGDSRFSEPESVVFEPRPAVTIGSAWALMPGYVPLRPNGTPYSVEQRFGDFRIYRGGSAYLRVFVQKPCSQVKLALLERTLDDDRAAVVRELFMDPAEVEDGPDGARRYYYERYFDLRGLGQRVNRYRVTAVDLYGFDSRRNPHRSIDEVEPEPPYVELLPERFPRPDGSITEEDIIRDLPIPPGEKVKIEYFCRSPIGFPSPKAGIGDRLNSPARLMVRVNDEPTPRILPLDEVTETPETGEYDLQRASFMIVNKNGERIPNLAVMSRFIKDSNGVQFCAKPSRDPDVDIPRREAGGVYYFPTKDLKKTDPEGKQKDLEVGDSIEFWIEVADRNGRFGRSTPPRRKEIRSVEEIVRQSTDLLETESKLREIDKRQTGVFTQPKK